MTSVEIIINNNNNYYYYYFFFLIALGTSFPKAKKLIKEIIML